MANLSKSLPSDAPLLFHRMANAGFDLNTIKALNNVIAGSEQPAFLPDVREYISELVELNARLGATINRAEKPVVEAIQEGQQIDGYAVTQTSRRKIVKPVEAAKILKEAGYKEDDYMSPRKLSGITVIDKLLKKNCDSVTYDRLLDEECIEVQVSEPKLKRK